MDNAIKSCDQQSEHRFTAEQIEKECPERLKQIGKEITERLKKADKQTELAQNHLTAVEQLLAEAKSLCDDDGFEKFRELVCPQLGKSQAYALLAIAAGKKTLAEHRTEERERKRRTRAKQKAAETSGTVPEKSEPAAEAHEAPEVTTADVANIAQTEQVKGPERASSVRRAPPVKDAALAEFNNHVARLVYGASTTNPKHWSSFEDVKQAYERAVEGGYIEVRQKRKPIQRLPIGGVGFVFDGRPDDNGLVYAGIDFDGVLPLSKMSSSVAAWLWKLPTYVEPSVSGTGLHLILKARPLPAGVAHNGIELYTAGRFFTMTGGQEPISTLPDEFAALAKELRDQAGKPQGQSKKAAADQTEGASLDLDDFESAARYLAGLTPSPFKDYHGWRDFMFACAHAEITHPADSERIRKLFAEASARSGGETANNDQLYEEALTATSEKLKRGEDVLTGRSIIALARDQGWISESAVYYFPGNEVACRTALDTIVAADPSTFTSGDGLVILRVPDRSRSGLERWSGDLPGTTPALPADIIERAERLAWMMPSRNGWRRKKPPRDFCADYIIQKRSRYGARPLRGIARVPYMGDDGSIGSDVGYDQVSGVFVDRPPSLSIPEAPTLDDARAALQRIAKPFEHYMFEDCENGSLQVFAANLTALERAYMKTAPMFVVNGAQAGTGKGQLCRAVGHLALGTTPPFMAWGHDDDEFKKRFDTMLLASPAMLVLDNCNNRLLRGDTLEMILSEGEATIRKFSRLEAVTVRNRTLFMANGNNIQISGDMGRRPAAKFGRCLAKSRISHLT